MTEAAVQYPLTMAVFEVATVGEEPHSLETRISLSDSQETVCYERGLENSAYAA